jgi:hypothetical protein
MAADDSTRAKRSAYQKAWREANREKLKAYAAARYIEKREESRRKNAENYRNNAAAYKARASAWAKANSRRRYEIAQKHRKANPDRYLAYAHADYRRNREKWLARNREFRRRKPEIVRQLLAEWKALHPEANGHHVGLRRARILKASPVWADMDAVRGFYDTAARLRRETGSVWHVDHMVPLKHPLVCGLHCEFNLRVIPGPENLAKHNAFVVE